MCIRDSTCIDTAGYGLSDYDEILNHTDLVLLDLKHIHKTDYEKMTGRSMDRFEEFLNALKKHQTKIWIRHVVVPGITDSEDHMAQLKAYIQKIPNVEKDELLDVYKRQLVTITSIFLCCFFISL